MRLMRRFLYGLLLLALAIGGASAQTAGNVTVNLVSTTGHKVEAQLFGYGVGGLDINCSGTPDTCIYRDLNNAAMRNAINALSPSVAQAVPHGHCGLGHVAPSGAYDQGHPNRHFIAFPH